MEYNVIQVIKNRLKTFLKYGLWKRISIYIFNSQRFMNSPTETYTFIYFLLFYCKIMIYRLNLRRIIKKQNDMKKLLLMVFMGAILFPSSVNAQSITVEEPEDPPVRNLPSTYVDVYLNEATGILTLSYFGKAGSMEVTISQNGAVIENDVIAVSNGQSVIYNLSGYAIGQYLLTIETSDGSIKQYIIYVEDD